MRADERAFATPPRRLSGAVLAAALLAACTGSGGPGGLIGIGLTPYAPANAIYPVGYSDEEITPDRYRITVTGSGVTSSERLERIATARAAEIGVELKRPFFKIENVSHTVRCTKKIITKGGDIPPSARPVTTLEAQFAKAAPDASYRRSKETFDELKATLDADPTAPDPALDTQVRAQCGA